ncbi:MAG: hypothetical protein H0U83_01955 [Sphingomonas sp.]|nr:hypothetical protein [Sphingomonas sp.]
MTATNVAPSGVTAQLLTPIAGGEPLHALFNTSSAPQRLPPEIVRGVAPTVLLSTSDPRYAGPGASHLAPGYALVGADAALDLPPHSAVLLRSSRSTPYPRAAGAC